MGRRFPSWNREGVGCKGGTSRTAGKKATTYTWTAKAPVADSHFGFVLPVGSILKARSFKVSEPTCKAYVFCDRDGKWYLNLCDGSWSHDKPHVIAERV